MYFRGLLRYTNRLLTHNTYALMLTFKLHDKLQIWDLDAALWDFTVSRYKYTVQIFINRHEQIFKCCGCIRVKYQDNKEFYYVGEENLTEILSQYIGKWIDIHISDGKEAK